MDAPKGHISHRAALWFLVYCAPASLVLLGRIRIGLPRLNLGERVRDVSGIYWWKAAPFWRLTLGLALIGSVTMQGASGSHARQPVRGVLFVDCPSAPRVLCQALVQSLATHATGHIIRLDSAPAGQDVKRVTLHIDPDQDKLSAYLSWQAPNGVSARGPVHRHGGQDVTKSPVAARQFTDVLVSKSPKLHFILAVTE
ncbi:hypothetical protein [uncultured Tateyamaria sp.]|uniref:hypothetical protein n=1 Tax=uncultured Tateyamaria sp. TaxID=455651 RepID=UPI00263A0BB9|nr:hypothetical protein [uncultured Tateyamaria sp.]